MKVVKKILNKVLILTSNTFEDERGSFIKLYDSSSILNSFTIKQVNFVTNDKQGVLRGLHYQTGVNAEGKIFRVIEGKINVVFFDLCDSSNTFKCASSVVLSSPDMALLVPKGFATGYEVLAPRTKVLYFSDQDYAPDSENGVRWNDPLVNRYWKTKSPKISEKDLSWHLWKV